MERFFRNIVMVTAACMAALLMLSIPTATIAKAHVVVNINKGVMKPIPIAINISNTFESLRNNVGGVIINDLEGTYLFKSIPEKAFMQYLRGIDAKPSFSLWKTINAQYLVNVEIKSSGENIYLSLILYDVLSEMQVGRFTASGRTSDWRKISHLTANYIYERVTGEIGYFDTKFLYVSVNRFANNRKVYRLAIMDHDGYGHKFLTNGSSIILTPRFAPNGEECAFFSYREKIVNGRVVPLSASVYRHNIKNGNTQLIARFEGMTYSPRYSPDGRLLIFSLSKKGASSIYTFNLITKEIRKLTKERSIDTSPCNTPDGKKIVYNSDRGGTQQLYIMDADGSNVRRLSFSSDARYATPVWSPRGDWIAFTKFGSSGFYIGVIRPDGSGERMIASGYLVEGPTWSPNGRVVLFSHQDYSKREKIFSVDITGYNKHEIATPFDAIDPEWSASTR
jgi:TolB protein